MADSRVPYSDGMTQGQGFNTYLQDGRLNQAVDVKEQSKAALNDNPVEIFYSWEKVEHYEKLARTLEITAGAGLSKMGIGGKFDTKFVDRSEYETSFLTFIVKVDVRQQPSSKLHYNFNWTSPSDPHETYGDRFISDFVTGGALFAKVSIRTSDSTVHRSIEQNVELGFPMYGVDVKVTQGMKLATDKITKDSEVRVYMHYVGAPPSYRLEAEFSTEDNPFLQLKAQADKFVADAKKHNWKRYALLEKYTNIPNFQSHFTPYNYSEAEERSWRVFNDLSEYFAARDTTRAISDKNYEGGRDTKTRLDNKANDAVQVFRTWVASVSADPTKSRQTPTVEPPEKFLKEVLLGAKWTNYIGQSLKIAKGRTHIIDTKLHSGAKQLFTLRGFNFGEVNRTARIVFAKKNDEDIYVCLIGQKTIPGYVEMSHLWVFEAQIQDISDKRVNVYDYPEQGVVELEADTRQGIDPLFDFYVRRA